MSNQIPEIQDKRNLLQRLVGTLLLEKCPKCHKYSFHMANYGGGGYCSVCNYKTPAIIPEHKKDKYH